MIRNSWWLTPGAAPWAIFVRLSLAGVFIFEGYQKLAYPDILGAGRFTGIGIPSPEFFGPVVGVLELLAGLLFLVGFASRVAAVPIIVIMLVAIIAIVGSTLGREIMAGRQPGLVSFGLIHFAGYLFFLLMPVEILVPLYLAEGHPGLVLIGRASCRERV